MTSESFRGDQKLRKKLWCIVENKNGMKWVVQRLPIGNPQAAHRRPTGGPEAAHRRPTGGPQAAHRRPTGCPEFTSFMDTP